MHSTAVVLSVLFAPSHPLGLVFVFPALALLIRRRFGARATFVAAWGVVAAALLFAVAIVDRGYLLNRGYLLKGVALFVLPLGAPALAAAVAVSALVERKRAWWLVYVVAVLAAGVAWFAGVIAVLAIPPHVVGGIA